MNNYLENGYANIEVIRMTIPFAITLVAAGIQIGAQIVCKILGM